MNTEIISVDAQEIPIEQAVEKSLLTSLEKMDITKKFLEEKRDECLELKLDGQSKEAYTIIRETRLNMKARRVSIEKICKKGREDATRTQKAWIAVQNDWVGIVSQGEDYLSNLEEEFEKEAERIKNEIKLRQEEAFILRQSDLTKMGAQYIGGNFVLNDISFEAVLVKEADDEVWNDSIKKKYYDQFLINEATRLAEEKKKQEAAEQLRLDQDKLDKEKREMEEARAELQRQQKEAELKEQLRVAEEKRLKDEADSKRWRLRLSQLTDARWNGQEAFYTLHKVDIFIVSYDDLIRVSDEEFVKIKDAHNERMVKIKEEEEKNRWDEVLEQKRLSAEDAAKKEREKIAEEQRLAEIKRQQDEARKAEELAQSSDKDKWNDFVSQLNKLSIPDMRSGQYRKKIQSVNRLLGEIKGL